ncbi:MAG: TauD/TfdA family dioxygenase [Gammaproteobacteria bacterium]|nr:TauD/TfdA family dioxygenase [Gammaproteobacteria bacterium]
MNEHPDIIELRNTGKAKDVNQHWHSDMTYNETPPKFTMLYALQTPAIGGDTAFSNQLLAYDDLSEGLKSTLAGMRAEHTAANLAVDRVQGRCRRSPARDSSRCPNPR